MDEDVSGSPAETGLATQTSTQQTQVNKEPNLTSTTSSAHPLTPLKMPPRASERQTASPTLSSKRSFSGLPSPRTGTPSTIRRTSSNLNPRSPSMPKQEPLTAGSVAKEYFRRDLQSHEGANSEVAFYVHDSCYGHRFSRPKTSKAALSTIVERPERIHATILGAATAYVRLGGRHAEGPSPPNPAREIDNDRPFVFKRTSRSIPLNHPAVVHVHGQKWMEELQIMCDSAEAKLALTGKELARPIGYGKDEKGNALPKLHEGDLYLCSESLAALQGCLGGVCDAVDDVLGSNSTKRAFVCIRPPGHHCSSDFPSGFCWLNNVHVGISYAAMNYGITHAAIIDFDLHHGDGSQAIAWNHNVKAQSAPKNAPAHKRIPIGYYSLHDINSYPCEWGDEEKVRNASLCIENAHGQSIWNVHLESWKTLEEFWQLYESRYMVLLEKARKFLRHHTTTLRNAGHTQLKAVIFISAGFDANEWEGEGMQRHKVNVPTDFYARFTSDIMRLAAEDDLAVEGRIISVLEGGYSDRALTSGVLSHACGLSSSSSDTDWWQLEQLETLEDVVAGRVRGTSTTLRERSPSHYSSPTHASNARMTDHAKERSISSQMEKLRLENQTHLQTFQPPPEVDWATAAHELSKLLIPTESRQTYSCRPEELNAEATRARRERQSGVGVPGIPPAPPPEVPRMQLRDRRVSRKTIADVSELPDPNMTHLESDKAPRRRRSSASSIMSGYQDLKLGTTRPTAVVPVKQPVVRKTRAPAVARQTKPAVQRTVLSKSSTNSSTGTRSRSHSQSTQANGSVEVKTDGMDDLLSGMKKISIKLKVPSAEEHAAKQAGTAETEKVKKERVPRKPPVPRAPRKAAPAKATETRTSPRKPVKVEVGEANPGRPVSITGAPMDATMQFSNSDATLQPSQYPLTPQLMKEDPALPVPAPVLQDPDTNVSNPSLPLNKDLTSFQDYESLYGHAPTYKYHSDARDPEVSERPLATPFMPTPSFHPTADNPLPPSTMYPSEHEYLPSYANYAPPPASSYLQHNESPMYPNLSSEPDFNHLPPAPQFVIPTEHYSSTGQTPQSMTKEDLPAFSSRSPIPFSALSASNYQDQVEGQHAQGDHQGVAIPETPMHNQDHVETSDKFQYAHPYQPHMSMQGMTPAEYTSERQD